VKQKLHLRYSFCDNGTIFFAEILHVISFISSEINIFTLPKHSKRSFALIFSSLTLCTERFIQRLPKTVTSAHSCAQGIIDHKKYLKINEGLVWSPLDSMDPRMTLEEQKSLVQEMVCFVLSHCGLPSKLLCFDDKKSFTKLLALWLLSFFHHFKKSFWLGRVCQVAWCFGKGPKDGQTGVITSRV